MTTLKNFGKGLAIATVAAGLSASAAFASMNAVVAVTLPDTAVVGDSTLSAGRYTIDEVPITNTDSLFVFRDNNGDTAAIAKARRSSDPGLDKDTKVVLVPDEEGTMHIDKMFVYGDSTGFKFAAE